MRIDLPAFPLAADTRGGLLVGYSGGLDSTVLLHLLATTPALRARGLAAVHVHHGLHPSADDWAAHCVRRCAALDLPCHMHRVEIARSGAGPEADARRARHAAFAAQLAAGDVLALAHHRDDQAETLLLRALRASGPDGLAAMRPLRPFAGGWLWRPLLGVARTQLEAYAHAHGLDWIEDPSNATVEADRNFLRHRVLPLLRTRWPGADAALATAAALQAEASGLLETDDARALAGARTLAPNVLRLDALADLPAARRARVLRRWIQHLGLPPLPGRALAWCEHAQTALDDRLPVFDWAGHRLQQWRGLLHADVCRAPLPVDPAVRWTGQAPLRLPDGGVLQLDGTPADDAAWTVRARIGGERIRLPGRAHSHALKHVLQSLAVPPWTRAQLPLLIGADGTLLAAGDLAFDARFDAWLAAGDRCLRWTPPPGAHTASDGTMA